MNKYWRKLMITKSLIKRDGKEKIFQNIYPRYIT